MNIINLDERRTPLSCEETIDAIEGRLVVLFEGKEWLLALNEEDRWRFLEAEQNHYLIFDPAVSDQALYDAHYLHRFAHEQVQFVIRPVEPADEPSDPGQPVWKLEIRSDQYRFRPFTLASASLRAFAHTGDFETSRSHIEIRSITQAVGVQLFAELFHICTHPDSLEEHGGRSADEYEDDPPADNF